MSLFTSNFRSETRVLLVVGAVALLFEGALRLGADRLSTDIKHIRAIPAVAARMAGSKGVRVLFLGNSLTREGLDLDSVRAEFGPKGSYSVEVERVYPDDTTILDWYYLFHYYFAGRSAPDYLVIGFVRRQLTDGTQIHPDRIAAYFGGWSNAHEMLSLDLGTTNQRADYMLSSTFRLFGEKERVRDRVLSVLTPDYVSAAKRLNESASMQAAGGMTNTAESYTRLERLLSLCARRKVRVVVVAMPIPDKYSLDPALLSLLSHQGAAFVDLRTIEGLTDDDYSDGYHLAPRGAAVYSRVLGRAIRGLIVSDPSQWSPGTLAPVFGTSAQ